MTITIPMSSSINELEKENNNEDINLDEIINNQILYDHKFSKYLIDNKLLDNLNIDPNLDDIYLYHIKKFCNEILLNNIGLTILHIINLFLIIFLFTGFLLPKRIILYHIILSMITLIMFDIMNDNNFFINKFSNKENNTTLLPLSLKINRILLFNLMIISILGLAFPEYSIFNLMNNLFINLKKYN